MDVSVIILLTGYATLNIVGIVVLICLSISNDKLHSEIKPIVHKAKYPNINGVYQPIHDTCGKYPPGYKPKKTNLLRDEQSISLVANMYNNDGKIVVEPTEINVTIVKDIKTSYAGVIVGDNDMIHITKEQLSTIIKFLS